MRSISEYAERSDIMKVLVLYNEKKYSWNMFEELKIVESKLNSSVKSQATNYAWLAMLHVKLKIKHRDQQKQVKRMKDTMMVKYKGKYKTVTEAEAIMYASNPKLKEAEDLALQIEELRDLLEVCVRAFEMKKDMLQSLSANIRKEK